MSRRRYPAWYTAADRRADQAARYGATSSPAPIGGYIAHHDGECARCEGPIVRLVSQVIHKGDGYIHATCASGADE